MSMFTNLAIKWGQHLVSMLEKCIWNVLKSPGWETYANMIHYADNCWIGISLYDYIILHIYIYVYMSTYVYRV